ncbi:MAG: UDP-N-acetyl-D-mannosamine dehydrogenase [Burkholderiaceae bacterium]
MIPTAQHTTSQGTPPTACVIGMGYIGLPTAALLASKNQVVIGVDVNRLVVDTINQGRIHIVEPELEVLVSHVTGHGFLQATATPLSAPVFMICVPTPLGDDQSPDMRYVESALESIAPVLKAGDLVIIESSSPVGTTRKAATQLQALRPDLRFPGPDGHQEGKVTPNVFLAYCPERALPGKLLPEITNNDRVIGGLTEACGQKAKEFYGLFIEGECFLTTAETAELCKLTENSYRDVNIAFANELSMVCDRLGVNVWELIRLANRHPRVNILQPGPGVGGHCIAVDPWFIVHSAPKETALIQTARRVNENKTQWVVNKILERLQARGKEALDEAQASQPGRPAVVALLGLSFKADIDDLRESPAIEIALELLQHEKATLWVVEPNIHTLPDCLKGKVELKDLETAYEKADLNVLLVDHWQFKHAQPEEDRVLDFKGLWHVGRTQSTH